MSGFPVVIMFVVVVIIRAHIIVFYGLNFFVAVEVLCFTASLELFAMA